MQAHPDFFLASTEILTLSEPRQCTRLWRLAGTHRSDYLLIAVTPPIQIEDGPGAGRELDRVMIATRHKGSGLFPVTEWPIAVYVCEVFGKPEPGSVLQAHDFALIAWAELYPTEAMARETMRTAWGDIDT